MKNIFKKLFGKKKTKVTLTIPFPCDTLLPNGRVYPKEVVEDAIEDRLKKTYFSGALKFYQTLFSLDLKKPETPIGTLEHPVSEDTLTSTTKNKRT